ncbi:MAG TPA: TatD family hydrolase [Gemmatimonadales bacterium]|jgi:TatD DNase family protein|nr:TatD family hydrolase [Gemmatimonadales bacterium]
MLVDTHCHLASDSFDGDRDQVLERAWAAGLSRVVVIGESLSALERGLALASTERRISIGTGIHPHDATTWQDDSASRLLSLWRDPRVVAAGEMGLDYHYDHSPREVQRRVFAEQLGRAVEAGKPVVVHAREADEDVAAILRNQPGATIVLHSFSSGVVLERAGLDLGWYFSFSGMITFRNWTRDDVIRAVPLDRLLVETDAPYLAPTPHRGHRNEPAFVRRVAEQIALVRGLALDDLIARTGENAQRVFNFAP